MDSVYLVSLTDSVRGSVASPDPTANCTADNSFGGAVSPSAVESLFTEPLS